MSSPTRSTTGAVARRRALAAGLVVAAVVATGVGRIGSLSWAAWVQAAVAVGSALVVLAMAPHQGRAAPPWRLMGIGMLVWAAGVLGAAGAFAEGVSAAPLPNLTDGPRLVGLVVLGVGLLAMAVARAARADWLARIDATMVGLAVAVGLTVVLWPEAADAHLSGEGIAVVAGALVVLTCLVAATVRFAFAGGTRLPSGRFLVAGMLALVAGAAALRSAQLEVSGARFDRMGLSLTATGSLLLAAAAVHPSARGLADREHRPAHVLSPQRLLLLVVSVASGPLVLVVEHLRGDPVDSLLLGTATALLVLLLAGRMQVVVWAGQQQAAREATIRDAVRAISAAHDATTIRAAVLGAAAGLLGGGLRYVAWVVVNERGAASPLEVLGPRGPIDRVEAGIDDALVRLAGMVDQPVRVLDSTRTEIVVAPIPSRLPGRSAIAVAAVSRVPDEIDESLTILATQCAAALDALLQTSELQDKRSEARFRQLVRYSSDAVLIVGRDGRIRYQTPSVIRVLGYLTVDLDGALLQRIVPPDEHHHLHGFIDQLVHAPAESMRTTEAQLLRADDSVIHAEIIGLNLLDDLDVGGVVLTIRDISGRRTLEDQLRHRAFHDPLTGLSNRALFVDRVEHALNRSRRDDVPTPAVAYIDLDDFKMVNDSLGHGAGDELLRVVADRLRVCLRSGDTPARLGGDEFAVLLEDAPDKAAVIEVAERILDALHSPMEIEGREVSVRASIGVAMRRGASTTPDELLRNADLAMYAAKANGKGCIELFEPGMHQGVVDRMALRDDLAGAVDRGDIEVAYQPIVRLADGEVVGFEALARWTHPERGVVSPVEFVPIAEENGAILALGRQVLEQACSQLAEWQAGNPDAEWQMSVNLSARQVLAPELGPMVREALERTGVDPGCLILELTETVLLADSDRVLRRLHQLKDLGVRIAIDDFGTGYSSLGYLQRVPCDILKVDRAFVSALRHETPSTTLVRTILDLARTLGRSVIAEGIEEQVELDGLLELGCPFGQGHLLGRPVDGDRLAAQLGLCSHTAL